MNSIASIHQFAIAILGVFAVACTQNLAGQSPLNPSFEAVGGGACQYNIPNATFNTNMANATGFGSASQIDIINTSCGFGAAQSGSYYIALAVDITNTLTDALTLTLSAPLVSGNSYTLTYYDRAHASYATNVMQVGLSTTAGAFGSLIYTSPLPTVSTWTLRSVNFVAPNNGQYLSMRTVAGAYGWNHIDNFQISPALPVEVLHFTGRALDENTDLLSWEWGTDEIPSKVEVQFMDEEGMFQTVESVNGSTRSILLDVAQPKDRHYRLRLIDSDGIESFSSIVEIARSTQKAELLAFPNTSNGRVCLQFTHAPSQNQHGILIVTDPGGRILIESPVDFSEDACIDLAPFGEGLRHFRLQLLDGSIATGRVVIVK